MAGCRHHGSWRRVRSEICALVLVGAVVACVIVDVSSLELAVGSPAAHRLSAGWPHAALEPYSTEYHHVDPEAGYRHVTLATLGALPSSICPADRPAGEPAGGSPPGAGAGSRPPPPATPGG